MVIDWGKPNPQRRCNLGWGEGHLLPSLQDLAAGMPAAK